MIIQNRPEGLRLEVCYIGVSTLDNPIGEFTNCLKFEVWFSVTYIMDIQTEVSGVV